MASGEVEQFRRDTYTQEATAEIQTRYLLLWNKYDGRRMKEDLVKMTPALPLVPKFNPDTFRAPIVLGPFDINDPSGVPLVDPEQTRQVYERMGLRRREAASGSRHPP